MTPLHFSQLSVFMAWTMYYNMHVGFSELVPVPANKDPLLNSWPSYAWKPPVDTGRESAVSPALASFGTSLNVAWRGPADDQGIYQAQISNAAGFQFNDKIAGIGSISGQLGSRDQKISGPEEEMLTTAAAKQ
jgi:hypothetical protein